MRFACTGVLLVAWGFFGASAFPFRRQHGRNHRLLGTPSTIVEVASTHLPHSSSVAPRNVLPKSVSTGGSLLGMPHLLAAILVGIFVLAILIICLMIIQAVRQYLDHIVTSSVSILPGGKHQLSIEGNEAAPKVNGHDGEETIELKSPSPKGSIKSWTQAALAVQQQLEEEPPLSSSPSPPILLKTLLFKGEPLKSKWKQAKKGRSVTKKLAKANKGTRNKATHH